MSRCCTSSVVSRSSVTAAGIRSHAQLSRTIILMGTEAAKAIEHKVMRKHQEVTRQRNQQVIFNHYFGNVM